MNKIVSFIEGVDCITDLQKEFYTKYLQRRYDLIVSPSLKRAKTMDKNIETGSHEKSFVEMLREKTEQRNKERTASHSDGYDAR